MRYARDEAACHRVCDRDKNDRQCARRLMKCGSHRSCMADDQIRLHLYKLSGEDPGQLGIARRVTISKLDTLALCPSQILHGKAQFSHILSGEWISFRQTHKHADAPNALGLLRTRRERPRHRRAAEQGDELAALHSITSSALTRSVFGIV